MKISQCSRESELLDALRSGRWSNAWGEEIRRHAATCALCAEVAFVAQALQDDDVFASAERQRQGTGLPSAGLVWWKAQRAARRAAEQQAVQPIALAERAAYASGGLTALGVTLWQWPRLAGWMRGAKTAVPVGEWFHGLGRALGQSSPGHLPWMLVTLSVAAALTVLALAAYVLCREE